MYACQSCCRQPEATLPALQWLLSSIGCSPQVHTLCLWLSLVVCMLYETCCMSHNCFMSGFLELDFVLLPYTQCPSSSNSLDTGRELCRKGSADVSRDVPAAVVGQCKKLWRYKLYPTQTCHYRYCFIDASCTCVTQLAYSAMSSRLPCVQAAAPTLPPHTVNIATDIESMHIPADCFSFDDCSSNK